MGDSRERLQAAYEATAYRVDAGPRGGFTIRVGAPSADVDALLAAADAETWAFITACNPQSRRLPDAENAARMTRLERLVRERGLEAHAGAGVGAGGDWPSEPSLLVVGVTERDAVAIATAFDQCALVVGRRGEPARLVWVESAASVDAAGRPSCGG